MAEGVGQPLEPDRPGFHADATGGENPLHVGRIVGVHLEANVVERQLQPAQG